MLCNIFLDERKKRILQAIVEEYINSAEPVSSGNIAKKYGLKSLVCGFNANTKGARLLFSKSQMKAYLQELQVDYYATLDFYKTITNGTNYE